MSTDAGMGTSVTCSVAPMLSVRNGARAVEFYQSAFGATEVYRVEDSGGSVVSRLSVDGAEFWLSDESPEHGNFSPESLGGGSVRMILTVPDPDAMFAKARAAGAREVLAVEEASAVRSRRDAIFHLRARSFLSRLALPTSQAQSRSHDHDVTANSR